MKKISRRSFLAAAGLTVAALALTACGGSASTASSAAASSVAASSEAASTSAAAAELTTVEAGKLTMATNATFPPYEMTTDSGDIAGIDIDTALSIEIADETIIERMSGRRTCKDCSATFHIVSNPPKVEGKCDLCGGELTIRKDDAPETVKARLDVYHAETEPLKDFYAQRGKLVSVDNQPTIEATTAAIEKALGLE